MITATCKHTFCAAHRLYDYNGKCEHLHGHNYQIEVSLTAPSLNTLGMVIDFMYIKQYLLKELDKLWDHRTLLFIKDPLSKSLPPILQDDSVCAVPFNPTAENMAEYLGTTLFPTLLKENQVPETIRVYSVALYETENNFVVWKNPSLGEGLVE